ncbi:tpr repeat-containing protein [Zalerion maritima]|uniref:Tpr repeat-containing protein n=1 Tax=Zalerion maritima TaxID=339359 RepID=A0AAD5RS37_9PEZI|nr:tpr repeat-containing protein [Zalerion maritima]
MKIEEITSSSPPSQTSPPPEPPRNMDANAFAPQLPPLVSSSREKSMDQLVKEFQSTPLFMTELPIPDDNDGEENTAIEALKALQSEGTPLENAADFKEQGNEHFKARIFSTAKEMYTKGIDILTLEGRKRALREKVRLKETSGGKDSEAPAPTAVPRMQDPAPRASDKAAEKELEEMEEDTEEVTASQKNLLETLLTNRSAVHLELGNYRSATQDCAAALRLNPGNMKAYYRSSRALLSTSRISEADDACARGLALDPDNRALKSLAEEITAKAKEINLKTRAEKERLARSQQKGMLVEAALKARGIKTRTTDQAPEMEDARMKMVPDEHDPTSTLCFPAVFLYPTNLESDFVKEFHEEQCLADHLSYVFPLPWDSKREYTLDSVECYMDSLAGGLIKVGKKLPLLRILGSGKVEVVDGVVRLFAVPKAKAESWVKEYKEKRALEMEDQRLKKRVAKS